MKHMNKFSPAYISPGQNLNHSTESKQAESPVYETVRNVQGVCFKSDRPRVPACAGIFPGGFILVTKNLALKWLPCQVPGIIGLALGLVGLVVVYCDWVRQSLICSVYLSVAAHTIV